MPVLVKDLMEIPFEEPKIFPHMQILSIQLEAGEEALLIPETTHVLMVLLNLDSVAFILV